MRGEALLDMPEALRLWITPACAGRSPRQLEPHQIVKDHPRVCGEKMTDFPPEARNSGSPPRVRGEEELDCAIRDIKRITPACAGRRQIKVINHRIAEDHPRVCGEKSPTSKKGKAYLGSPPRVRGEGQRFGARRRALGITPACAGRSFCCILRRMDTWDHPRVCGEKYLCSNSSHDFEGSPPRVRGEACIRHEAHGAVGITPACAGRSLHAGQSDRH